MKGYIVGGIVGVLAGLGFTSWLEIPDAPVEFLFSILIGLFGFTVGSGIGYVIESIHWRYKL